MSPNSKDYDFKYCICKYLCLNLIIYTEIGDFRK